MDCRAAWSIIEAPGEVPPGELDRAGHHMEGCAACQARLDGDVLLPPAFEQLRAPPELGSRISSAVDTVDQASRRAPVRWQTLGRRLAPLAASMLLGAVLASAVTMQLQRPDADRAALEQAVSAHIGAQLADRLTQVTSAETHTVKPWFAGRIDLAPPVRDLAGQGFALKGGRIEYLGNRSSAVLTYQIRKHHIDLYVTPAGSGHRPARMTSDRGYNVVDWTSHGFRLIAVSDVNQVDLARFQAAYAAN